MFQALAARLRSSREAISTNSARELAFIFCITRPRCAFTVLADAKLTAYLLIQQATHNQRHHLLFAGAKRFVTVPEPMQLRIDM